MKKACFCGTFDPVTKGHLDIIERASKLFDELIVFVSVNADKTTMFSTSQRQQWLQEATSHLENVRVKAQNGLVTQACRDVGATVLVRGIRNGIDFEYEKNMAVMNDVLDPNIETVVLFTAPEYMHCSSSNVREFLRYGKDVSMFVPACVAKDLKKGEWV